MQLKGQKCMSKQSQSIVSDIAMPCHLNDQPTTPCHGPHHEGCHGPLVVVADDEVVQRRCGGPRLKRTWRTEESIGTASVLWLQTGADDELLLPIVLSRTGDLSAKFLSLLPPQRDSTITSTV